MLNDIGFVNQSIQRTERDTNVNKKTMIAKTIPAPIGEGK